MNYIENIFYDGLISFINDNAEEIRIRINKPAMVLYPQKEVETDIIYTKKKSDSYSFSDSFLERFII